jgi:hypothetical protein
MAAKWTFMVYIAGFNNLSPFASKDLEEMREVGSTDDVKVAVFVKQLDRDSAERLIVQRDGQGESPEQLGDVDSGNPQTMLDFVRWAAQSAPAERYALVVWNHGSGWQPDDLEQIYSEVRAERGATGVTGRELGVRASQQIDRSLFSSTVKEVLALPDAGERGIASDDGTGHSLDTIELSRVLESAHEGDLGQPFELLGMDACLMSTLEVSYEARAHTRNVVGSEELEPGDGWPYSLILGDLVANPDMDGAELGRTVVRRYAESYRNDESKWPITQCAVASDGIDAFSDSLDTLAGALRGFMRDDELGVFKVQQAQARSADFTGELYDLRTLCANLRGLGPSGERVEDAAAKVMEALEPGSYVLAEEHLGPTVEGCGGVTAYLPPPSSRISRFYGDLSFAKQHGWDEFLRSYHRAIRGE